MKKKETGKNKHLTIEQRKEIEGCLDHGVSFKAIGARIGKDPTTVSYEDLSHPGQQSAAFFQEYHLQALS